MAPARSAETTGCLTGFPDVEGIETGSTMCTQRVARLTGFPDVEGIETFPSCRLQAPRQSDRLP